MQKMDVSKTKIKYQMFRYNKEHLLRLVLFVMDKNSDIFVKVSNK